MSNDTESTHTTDRGSHPRGGDSYTELLLGVFRDVQQQSTRVTEQARELASLCTELRSLGESGARREVELREELSAKLGDQTRACLSALAQARDEGAKALEELVGRLQTGLQKSESAQRGLGLRLEALEGRFSAIEADLLHERERLSEARAEIHGAQDKLVRSAVFATDARARSRRTTWIAVAALLAALWALGQWVWPSLRVSF